MRNIFVFSAVFLILLTSCNKEVTKFTNFNKVVEYSSEDLSSYQDLGVYSNLFVPEENITASIKFQIDNQFINSKKIRGSFYFWDTYNVENIDSGIFNFGEINAFSSFKNGEVSFIPENAQPLFNITDSNWNYFVDAPDKIINNQINTSLTLNEQNIFSEKVEFPDVLNMTPIGQETHDIHGTICDRDNFEIVWNGSNNNNGVLVFARFLGQTSDNFFESNYDPIYRMMIVEDDGIEVIPNDLFTDMPENAIVQFELWCGNKYNFEGNDSNQYSCSLLSNAKFSVVLK